MSCKRRAVATVALAAALSLATSLAGFWGPFRHEAPRDTPPTVSIDHVGTYHLAKTALRPAIDITVEQRETQESFWPEDYLRIRASCRDGKWQASWPFYSAYGSFQIDLVDLSGDGIEEGVFILEDGHGTGPLPHTLVVQRLTSNRFMAVLRRPQSGGFGPGVGWRYEPSFVDVNRDGTLDLRLVLDYDQPASTWLDVPELVPHEVVVEYVWDHDTERLVLYRTERRLHTDLLKWRIRSEINNRLGGLGRP